MDLPRKAQNHNHWGPFRDADPHAPKHNQSNPKNTHILRLLSFLLFFLLLFSFSSLLRLSFFLFFFLFLRWGLGGSVGVRAVGSVD